MPKVSVCLPTFNGERYLAQAIRSVLDQTFADFELLIADDGSSDKSLSIAETFAAQDGRVRVWRNECNLGLFENYNECMRRAEGQYIKPFAQDDVLHSDCLKGLVETLDSQRDVQLVSTARQWIGSDGQKLKDIVPFESSRVISGREVIRYNLIQLTNWVGEPSTVMFRRDRLGTGFDTSLYHYGDIEYWFRIVEEGNYFYLNEVLCSFRRHSESTTSKNLSGMFFALDVLKLGKQYRGYLAEIGESEEHFLKRALEVSAINIDHLVRAENLDATKSVGARSGRERTAEGARFESDGFKELSYHALRYITELIAEYDALRCRTDAEREHLQQQLEDMKQSTSWKLTAPLRQMSRSRGA